MADELVIDLRRTQLLAVDSNLDDARRALVRAARIPSAFAAELREVLAIVAALEDRVLANAAGNGPELLGGAPSSTPSTSPAPDVATTSPSPGEVSSTLLE